MANTVIVNGDTRKFAINENIKHYSLIDVGFVKSPKGNFIYEYPLYNESPYNVPTKSKTTINQDLDHLTMVITDKNGLQKVNIFKNQQLKPMVELLNFTLKDLIEREIIKPL